MNVVASFPVLKTTELVASLVEIGIQITADDIDRPMAAKVIPIYSWFLNVLGQLTLDDVMVSAQLTLDNISDDNSADIYREAVYVGALFSVLNQVMQWACVDDFSPQDIRDPTPKRYRKILSALLNFYLFEQDQFPNLMTFEDQAEQLTREQYDLERKRVEMQSAVERKQHDIERETALAIEVDKQTAEMRNILMAQKDVAQKQTAQIDQAKRARALLQAELEDSLRSIAAYEVDIGRLKSRIVRSPDRMRTNLTELAKQVATMKDDVLEHEARARDFGLRIQALKRYEGELNGVIRILEEYQAEQERAQQNANRLAVLTEERDAKSDELKELELRRQATSRRINVTLEQKQRHEKQAETKKDSAARKLREMQEALELLLTQRQDADEESAKRHRAIALKEREILDLVKSADSSIAQGELAYRELKMDILSYSAKLNKALDSLNAFNAV